MKNNFNSMTALLALLIALFAFGCKKEDEKCDSCQILISNLTGYPVKVFIDGTLRETIDAGIVYTGTIIGGLSHTVSGEIQTGFAHTNYKGTVSCSGDCGPISIKITN